MMIIQTILGAEVKKDGHNFHVDDGNDDKRCMTNEGNTRKGGQRKETNASRVEGTDDEGCWRTECCGRWRGGGGGGGRGQREENIQANIRGIMRRKLELTFIMNNIRVLIKRKREREGRGK